MFGCLKLNSDKLRLTQTKRAKQHSQRQIQLQKHALLIENLRFVCKNIEY